MSDTDKSGPGLDENVQELQAKFPSDAALQDALGRLRLLGFDHADLSLPDPEQPASPDAASAATGDTDVKQIRTMASGLTGYAAGAAVAAGLATGGVAVPVVAAAAGLTALGASAATSGAGVAADSAAAAERDRMGEAGTLVLAVRIRSADQLEGARQALQEAGTTGITEIVEAGEAVTRGVNSASWTG